MSLENYFNTFWVAFLTGVSVSVLLHGIVNDNDGEKWGGGVSLFLIVIGIPLLAGSC